MTRRSPSRSGGKPASPRGGSGAPGRNPGAGPSGARGDRFADEMGKAAEDACRLFGWCCGCGCEPWLCVCVCATCDRPFTAHEPVPPAGERVLIGNDVYCTGCLGQRTDD